MMTTISDCDHEFIIIIIIMNYLILVLNRVYLVLGLLIKL